MDAYAFYYCSSLSNITIPDNVTTIGVEAFYNCSSLTSATPQSLLA
ncbi:MAG: leucine-rich repeat domain-containing protein [Clostridiales bacterium]|nr:leucine-rich repeat domain-containing protein [Clostridiales bacterium]